ncbi:hypothetical protein [Brevibacillus migulae]|uniref:hypothetical protein n=1 Tax=Brevibacillus migulae TaxID=1644114 RepID=UPI00106E9B3C|nr:hypothetical protein [Brevibacillus migulae]
MMDSPHQPRKDEVFTRMMSWVESRYDCEVYFLEHSRQANGFVEYRNGKNIIYILADKEDISLDAFTDILAHEVGHVIYNQRMMQNGLSYKEIVKRTQDKLDCFDLLLERNVITKEEYERLYRAIEEEWASNQEKGRIIPELRKLVDMDKQLPT